MKTKISVLTLILVIALIFSVVGCGGGQQTAKKDEDIVIAVVPKALDNPIFLDAKEAAEDKGEELGIKVEWVGPVKSDATEQVAVIEGLIEKKVDGILISCNDPDALKGVIDRAADEGIKVATFDADSPDSKRLFYCGTDNYKAGEVNAEHLMELTDSKGKVVILTGVPGASNLEERIRGFKDKVEGTDIEILGVQACDDDINRSVEVVEQYTKAHPELNAWFFAGGWPFFAPPDAFPELKKFRENDGVIVSMDTFYPMLKFIQEDMVDVLIGQDYSAMGEIGVEKLYKAVKGEEMKEDIIDTGLEIVTDENVEEVLKTKKPWD